MAGPSASSGVHRSQASGEQRRSYEDFPVLANQQHCLLDVKAMAREKTH